MLIKTQVFYRWVYLLLNYNQLFCIPWNVIHKICLFSVIRQVITACFTGQRANSVLWCRPKSYRYNTPWFVTVNGSSNFISWHISTSSYILTSAPSTFPFPLVHCAGLEVRTIEVQFLFTLQTSMALLSGIITTPLQHCN
jgi:hypothetical protein